jgi:hypothetical protein
MSDHTKQPRRAPSIHGVTRRVKVLPMLFRHAPLSAVAALVLTFGVVFLVGAVRPGETSTSIECCGELKARDVASWRERVRDAQGVTSDATRAVWSTESLSFVSSMKAKSSGVALTSWQAASELIEEFSTASPDQAGAVAHRMALLADRMASLLVGESAPVVPLGSGGAAADGPPVVLTEEVQPTVETTPGIVNQDSSGSLQSR